MKRLWQLLCTLRLYRLANALAMAHNAPYAAGDMILCLRHPNQTNHRRTSFVNGLFTTQGVGWVSWLDAILPEIEEQDDMKARDFTFPTNNDVPMWAPALASSWDWVGYIDEN
jgi:hypothetical protein